MMPAYTHRQAAWSLSIDGNRIDDKVKPLLISLTLTEKRGTDADELEISLSDHDGQLAIPPKGARISLSLGWQDTGQSSAPGLIDKGQYLVDETTHEGTPDRLTIRARSADLTKGFRTRRTKSWKDATLGAVLGDLAGRNGLQLRCSDELASIEISHLSQSRESDAALLSRLGRTHDAVATVKAGRLIFSACGAGQSPSGQDLGSVSLTRRDGDKHSWKASDRGVYSGVIAEWHDRQTATRKKAVAGSESNAKSLTRVYASEAAALTAARAEHQRLQRGAAEFSLSLAHGRPDLMPEKAVKVSGFKPQIDSENWLVTEVRHSLTSRGLTSAVQMELKT